MLCHYLPIEHFLLLLQMSVDFVDLACQKQSYRNVRSHNLPESAASQGINLWLPLVQWQTALRRVYGGLKVQWDKVYCSHVILFLCPYDKCGINNVSKEDMLGHLKLNHLRGSQPLPAIYRLLFIAQVMPNNWFVSHWVLATLFSCPPEGLVN